MSEDYDFLTDVTISKVYEGKSGESQYGKWTAYNFYVNGDDRKFSYFKTEKSPLLPVEGMRLKMLRFEEVTKGGYTNYNVKEMFLYKESEKPPQTRSEAPQSTISNKDASFYVSYAKDLMCEAMKLNEDYGMRNVEDLGEIVVRVGIKMMNIVNGKETTSSTYIANPKIQTTYTHDTTAEWDGEPPQHGEFSDGTPIGDPPPF